MDTATEIQERGILLDDAPFHYGPPSFFERLPTEFMASGYSLPWSPGDLPQMIPVDLLQEKNVRRDSTICGAGAELAFVNVRVLHFSQVTPIGYAQILAAAGITEIVGVYYSPSRAAVKGVSATPSAIVAKGVADASNATEIECIGDAPSLLTPVEVVDDAPSLMLVKADDPSGKKRKRGRPASAGKIQTVLRLLLDDGEYPLRGENGVKTREDQYRVVTARIHKRFPNKFPGDKGIKNAVIKRELRAFEIRENIL
jgi:hypothetical protein